MSKQGAASRNFLAARHGLAPGQPQHRRKKQTSRATLSSEKLLVYGYQFLVFARSETWNWKLKTEQAAVVGFHEFFRSGLA
jgi:hypothetical protein